MDIHYLFLIFRSRLVFVISCTVACAMLALGAAYLLRTHAATASLLIRTPIVELSDASRRNPASTPAMVAIEVLSSPRIATRVITALRLSPDHPHVKRWGTPDDADVDINAWMAGRLVRETRFSAAPDSNVVAITTVAADRDMALALANAFTAAYVEVSREVQADEARARASQLQQGMPLIEQELKAAAAEMSAFRRVHPRFNPNSRGDDSMVATLSNQLAQVESELSTPTAAGAGNLRDPALQVLVSEAQRARARWIDASSKYGYNHPNYKSAAAELNVAESAVRDAAAHADRANSSKAASLRASLRQEQDRAVQQSALNEEYSVFQRKLAAAENAANINRNALRQARETAAGAIGTASVFASAALQPRGITDPWRRALPLGAALGLLLGTLGALLAEEMSPRFRRTRSAIAGLGSRLLANIPAAGVNGATDGLPTRPLPARARRAELQAPRQSQTGEPLASDSSAGHALDRIRATLPAEAANELQPVHPSLPQYRKSEANSLHRTPSVKGPSAFVVDVNPTHPVAEAIRELRTQVLLEWRRSAVKRPISLQSLFPGDGRTFIACNLAIAFAQANVRTALVDLHLRDAKLHSLFGLDASTGVSTMLAKTEDRLTPHTVDARGHLDVIPAGPRPPNPQELFSGLELPALLEHLGQRYEAVILDGPAWTCGADALLIAAAGADVVLAARNDRTPLRQLQEMRDQMERLDVRVLGAVGNDH